MKYGVRECANIVFRAKQATKIGDATFNIGQPVLYIDTATTSTLERGTTQVYAQGGRGNARLISWEGDTTLTFTVTDALISPVSLAMLSGAGLISKSTDQVHVHAVSAATMTVASGVGTIDLTDALAAFGGLDKATVDAGTDAPIFIMHTEDDGSIDGSIVTAESITYSKTDNKGLLTVTTPKWDGTTAIEKAVNVLVDYYVIKNGADVSEIQITAQDFAGYYYVEADTLWRAQEGGIDMPANLTFPNVKLQSGFTIQMAGTGDPSTFDFTMDAFPGYTYFDKTKKVLCVIQVVEDAELLNKDYRSVMLANNDVEHGDPLAKDSDLSEPVG